MRLPSLPRPGISILRAQVRAGIVVDASIGDDLLVHATRAHAAALRELPEVRLVVPSLPELKITPHFAGLLGNTSAEGPLLAKLV